MGCCNGFHKINVHTITWNLRYEVEQSFLIYFVLRNPELNSTYSQCLYWANFCNTPTQINEIPKPLVRTVQRDSTWSRTQKTYSQAFLKENVCCFSGKCPSARRAHDQSKETMRVMTSSRTETISHNSLSLLTSLFPVTSFLNHN